MTTETPEQYRARIDAEIEKRDAVDAAQQKAKLYKEVRSDLLKQQDHKKAVAKRRRQEKAAVKTEIVEGAVDPDDFIRPVGGGAPIAKSQHNIYCALRKLGVRVSHDEFADISLIEGPYEEKRRYLDDATLIRLHLRIDLEFRFLPPKEFFFDVICNLARVQHYHPVRDYLNEAQSRWDGAARLDTWLQTYAGAEDTPFNRAAGVCWMLAAVRRIRQPGCKFDELPVLEAPQGTLKSSMLAVLAVHPDWFTDGVQLNAEAKVVIEQTRGKWIAEIAEMAGMRKAELEKIKAFTSRQRDSARRVWGKLAEHVDRAFVCMGTTNTELYLTDLTGARRFWPIKTEKIDLEALKRDLKQLWGEAAAREAKGESIRLPESLWEAAREVQTSRQVDNPYADVLAQAFAAVDTGKITKADIYRLLDMKPDRLRQGTLELIAAAMKALGWQATTAKVEGTVVRAFIKGTAFERTVLTVSWSEHLRRYVIVDKPVFGAPESAFQAATERLAGPR